MNIRNIRNLCAGLSLPVALISQAGLVAHFSMDVEEGQIRESISGARFAVEGNFPPENVKGVVGEALRFDGYTSHVTASIGEILPAGAKKMTVSLWTAVPCYPIIQLDTDTQQKTPVVSCLDEEKKTGFGFYLGFDGKFSFKAYIGGWPIEIEAVTPLPPYQWNNLVAVIDCDTRHATLYHNGTEAGSAKVNGTINLESSPLYMGQGEESRMLGPFELMSFNGLIDDISVWDEAIGQEEILKWQTDETPDLDIPASRFADDILRPRFHGMPAAGWTNECHGLWHADGRYHLFFQKNADGPYMARLHWGHISSENLYDWQEEKIALAPGEPYDIKGCWSGCVFSDPIMTQGKPNILYTSVDYAKASVSRAYPLSPTLEDWRKEPDNPIIGSRPDGLSDDFRDPYFFRHGNEAYIIVGSSADGIGTTTLHRYEPVSGRWQDTGRRFFSGSSASADGSFWEMPNITEMPDGKWLFTATPLGTSQGVRTLFWTGDITTEGTFAPDSRSSSPRLVEMNSREGFGMLSPTVFRDGDKTIALGIVPDKLPSDINWRLGWAHCYSLPREWSLDPDGALIQKPFSGLTGLRTETSFTQADLHLAGWTRLEPVAGREVEVEALVEVNDSEFGFDFFKSGDSFARVYYSPATGEVIADFSRLPRIPNDEGVYDGIYRCALPERIANGDQMKINLFIDHSILDIFVNDRWATSIRVFPTDKEANGLEAFSTSGNHFRILNAWELSASGSGAGRARPCIEDESAGMVDVYDHTGTRIRHGVARSVATEGLSEGLYIVGDRKILIRQ